jgi:hypothetical protein
MKRWTAVLLVLAAGALSGCCCPGECQGDYVPVSLEGCHDFLQYYGRCYHRFPYSCPPCPYYSGVDNGYQVYSEYDLGKTPIPAEEGAPAELPEYSAPNDENPTIPQPENEGL